jgi:hypothetical protein
LRFAGKAERAPKHNHAQALKGTVLSLALDAVCVSVAFTSELGPVPNQETGVAGELVFRLRNYLDDQLFGDKFSAWREALIEGISFVEFVDDAAGIRGGGGLQSLQGAVLGFLDVGTDFVIVGCHLLVLIPYGR